MAARHLRSSLENVVHCNYGIQTRGLWGPGTQSNLHIFQPCKPGFMQAWNMALMGFVFNCWNLQMSNFSTHSQRNYSWKSMNSVVHATYM